MYDFKKGKYPLNVTASCEKCLAKTFHPYIISISGMKTKSMEVVDYDVLKKTPESNPNQNTQEGEDKFNCPHSTMGNYLRAIGKVNRCRK